ncbi:GNAT family N-acetyltransferase [Amycolatopsis sp. FDAARGOS 1241]|uniref:GNAT family N-acetyltransferase n=1 Tax=Amycolatopsis sp. FDAARGOS 1241 TaxID=2778070 RepID=UPI001EF2E55F|nr:GNAT family N-acetyltransferase [Amycolatopsis sp. FDAARGOS 1241]
MTSVITVVEPATLEAVTALVRACSPESLAWRFTLPGRPDPERILVRYRPFLLAGEALVAMAGDAPVGLVNLMVDGERRAELGVLVADAWHRRRIASTLVRYLFDDPRHAGWTVHATVLVGNNPALGLLRAHGFRGVPSFERGELEFEHAIMTDVMEEVADGGIGEAGAGPDGLQRRAAGADAGRRWHGHARRGGAREGAAGVAAALLPRR